MKFSGFDFQLSGLRTPPPLRGLCDFRPSPSAARSRLVAFTLLELLVALAVMSMMLAFMFQLMGASLSFWETGNRRMEAAQAARIGLNLMANDLKNALAGNRTSYTTNGSAIQNIAPFKADSTPSPTATWGLSGAENAAGSQQLCGVLLTGNTSIPYNEFGFYCALITGNSTRAMSTGRYYLVRKMDDITSSGGDFYFRNSPDTNWFASSSIYDPIIDNCIRLTFQYYGNQTTSTGTPEWTSEWSPTDRLPLGVLVTATVLDSRTVQKLADINNNSALSVADIDAGINAANGSGSTSNNIQRLISQGAVTVRRFIPLNPG
jgi:type II secretory pathway pseudopilin PulG